MKRRRKLAKIENKNKSTFKVRNPIAPPSIRHKASKGTGYNRHNEKKELRKALEQVDTQA